MRIKECKITEDYCSQEVVKLLKDEISSSDLSYIWQDNIELEDKINQLEIRKD